MMCLSVYGGGNGLWFGQATAPKARSSGACAAACFNTPCCWLASVPSSQQAARLWQRHHPRRQGAGLQGAGTPVQGVRARGAGCGAACCGAWCDGFHCAAANSKVPGAWLAGWLAGWLGWLAGSCSARAAGGRLTPCVLAHYPAAPPLPPAMQLLGGHWYGACLLRVQPGAHRLPQPQLQVGSWVGWPVGRAVCCLAGWLGRRRQHTARHERHQTGLASRAATRAGTRRGCGSPSCCCCLLGIPLLY